MKTKKKIQVLDKNEINKIKGGGRISIDYMVCGNLTSISGSSETDQQQAQTIYTQ